MINELATVQVNQSRTDGGLMWLANQQQVFLLRLPTAVTHFQACTTWSTSSLPDISHVRCAVLRAQKALHKMVHRLLLPGCGEAGLVFGLLLRLDAVGNILGRLVCLTALWQQIKSATHVITSVAAGLSASISCSEGAMGWSPAGVNQCDTTDCSGAVQMNTNGSAWLIKETERLQEASNHSWSQLCFSHSPITPTKQSSSLSQRATEYSPELHHIHRLLLVFPYVSFEVA